MPRLSMNQLTTFRWSLDEDLYHYREAGFEGLGLWLRKLEDFGVERGIELIAESGLAVSNVFWAGGFTGTDAASSEENLAATEHALQLASQLRAASLLLRTGGRNRHTSRHARRLLHNAIDRLLPQAERARVPLALEPMHPACAVEWTTLDTLESAWEVVEQYDTPWLRLVYDTYHFPLSRSSLDLIDQIAPRLAVVHLGDSSKPHDLDQQRCALGAGTIPLERIVRRLLAAGYDGFLDVELMGLEAEETDYEPLLRSSIEACQMMTDRVEVGSVG